MTLKITIEVRNQPPPGGGDISRHSKDCLRPAIPETIEKAGSVPT
jgi:hypothetical protein